MYNVHDVEKLTLVFMETFNLNIKNGIWINIITSGFQDCFSKAYFVFLFDSKKRLLKCLILSIFFKLSEFIQICNPTVTDCFCNQLSKLWIGFEHPPTL